MRLRVILVLLLLLVVVSCAESNPLDDQTRELRKRITENPNDAQAHFMLGHLYSSSFHNKYEDALQEFKKAVEIDPSFSEGYFWLGNTYQNLQRNDDALVAFEKAIDLGMATPRVYESAAIQLSLMNKKESVDKKFLLYGEKAVELACTGLSNKEQCLQYLANFINAYLSFSFHSQENLTLIEKYINKGFQVIGPDTSSKAYYEFIDMLGATYYSYDNDLKKWAQARELFEQAEGFFTKEKFPYEHNSIQEYKILLKEKIANQKYLLNDKGVELPDLIGDATVINGIRYIL